MTYETDAITRALVSAQRQRIADLERQLEDAAASLKRAQATVRQVLDGTGASLEEKLRASVAIAETSGLLALAVRTFAQPTPDRCTMYRERRPRCANPTVPGKSSAWRATGLAPIRKLAIVRAPPAGAAYEASDFFSRVRQPPRGGATADEFLAATDRGPDEPR
jgi:hypothetical protein